MKKIINGSLYNTETAKKLGEWSTSGIPRSDFSYCCETLYKTKSGKYFLHGYGGPQTAYAESVRNVGWLAGEKIVPLSLESAREWAEKKLNTDVYIEIFGEPEEASDNKEPLNITLSPEIKRKLTLLKEKTGKSISQIIEEKFSE